MNPSHERAAFEANIDKNPLDASNHLVYADWLDENNEPNEAAFRRAMGEWVRLGPDDYRGMDSKVPVRGAYRDYQRPAQENVGRREGGVSIHHESIPDWALPGLSSDTAAGDPNIAHRISTRFYWPTYRHMEEGLRRAFMKGRSATKMSRLASRFQARRYMRSRT